MTRRVDVAVSTASGTLTIGATRERVSVRSYSASGATNAQASGSALRARTGAPLNP